MTRSVTSISDSALPMGVSIAIEQACAIDAEPRVRARKLRDLAAWYRAFAAQAANPAIWESRLFTADLLDAEANRMDPLQGG